MVQSLASWSCSTHFNKTQKSFSLQGDIKIDIHKGPLFCPALPTYSSKPNPWAMCNCWAPFKQDWNYLWPPRQQQNLCYIHCFKVAEVVIEVTIRIKTVNMRKRGVGKQSRLQTTFIFWPLTLFSQWMPYFKYADTLPQFL